MQMPGDPGGLVAWWPVGYLGEPAATCVLDRPGAILIYERSGASISRLHRQLQLQLRRQPRLDLPARSRVDQLMD